MSQRFAAARAAMLEEARRPRGPTWTALAVLVCATLWGLMAVIAAAGAVAGKVTARVVLHHALPMAAVGVVTPLVVWATFAPGRRGLRLVATLASAVVAVAVVLLRPAPLPGAAFPDLICTVSHLAADVLPAAVVLLGLTRHAHARSVALTGGLAAGLVGVLVGELVCEQGPLHVLLFHLPAWAATALLVLAVSPRLPRRSFAP